MQTYTSAETRQISLPKGKWFVNVAQIGDSPKWEIQPEPYNTKSKLFGYPEKEFLAKQYK